MGRVTRNSPEMRAVHPHVEIQEIDDIANVLANRFVDRILGHSLRGPDGGASRLTGQALQRRFRFGSSL